MRFVYIRPCIFIILITEALVKLFLKILQTFLSPIRLLACHGNIFVLQFIFIFPSFPVIYSKRQAGFPLRLNTATNLFYDFFFTCFKNQPLFAAFSYFLTCLFSLSQIVFPFTFPPFFVLFFNISPLTYKRTLFSRQYTVSGIISPNFYKFFCRIFLSASA